MGRHYIRFAIWIMNVCCLTWVECSNECTNPNMRNIKRCAAQLSHSETVSTVDLDKIENYCLDNDELLHAHQADIIESSWHCSDLQADRKKRTLFDFENNPEAQWAIRDMKYTYDGEFGASQKEAVATAFEMWSSRTCLTFTEIGEIESPETAHIQLRKGGDCISYTGRGSNIPQPIFLADYCFHIPGRIAHAIGHMLGLWHEHQRPDRDMYVNVNLEAASEGEQGNFMVLPVQLVDVNGPYSDYDYASIMHYEQYRLSYEDQVGNRKPTITPILANYEQTVGQLVEPSFWDVAKINYAYCTECTTSLTCESRGYPDPTDCTKCICPEGFDGSRCQNRPEGEPGLCGSFISLEPNYPVHQIGLPDNSNYLYSIGQKCTWDINVAEGSWIRASFEGDFEIFCRDNVAFHFVEIRHADMVTTGPRFCGTTRPEAVLISEANTMKVLFNSVYNSNNPDDVGVLAGVNKGFSLKLELININCGGCNINLVPGDVDAPCIDTSQQEQRVKICTRTNRVCVPDHCHWWNRRRCRRRQRCHNEVSEVPCGFEMGPRLYCCGSATLFHPRENLADTQCMVEGWSAWGNCEGHRPGDPLCGGCARERRSRHSVRTTNQNCGDIYTSVSYDAITHYEERSCAFAACTDSSCPLPEPCDHLSGWAYWNCQYRRYKMYRPCDVPCCHDHYFDDQVNECRLMLMP